MSENELPEFYGAEKKPKGTEHELKIRIQNEGEFLKKLEELQTELDLEREKRLDYEEKLQLIAEKEFQRRKDLVDAPEEIQTPEELRGFELARRGSGLKGSGSGVVSLESQSRSGERLGFSSALEMVQYLSDMSKTHGAPKKEAEAVLDELWKKGLRGAKDLRRGIEVSFPTSSQLEAGETCMSLINKEYRRKHGLEEVENHE